MNQFEMQNFGDNGRRAELDYAVMKERLINNEKLDLAQKKLSLREINKEMEKSKYYKIIVGEDGGLEVMVKSAIADIFKRKLSNLRFPELVKLKSSDGDEGIYILKFKIAEVEKEIYIESSKVGKEGYLMNKILAVGGEIYTRRKDEAETLIKNLWTALISQCQGVAIVPVHHGWIREVEGTYRFVEEDEILWKQLKDMAS